MRREYKYYVYIATNRFHKVLYTGVTNNISRRRIEHETRAKQNSFTAKYSICKIVYYEIFKYIEDAIEREKQVKAGSRKKKLELIYSINPTWDDLIEKYHK